MKYMKGWTYDVFLYKNYGFSHTERQKSQALATYIRLNKNDNLKKTTNEKN
jgi:hypothetical protein